jgi:hypothetical protein
MTSTYSKPRKGGLDKQSDTASVGGNQVDKLRGELGRHWIKANLNLGQYKSELQCICGAKLIEDGHANDWRSSYQSVVNNHLAEAIIAITENTTNKPEGRLTNE